MVAVTCVQGQGFSSSYWASRNVVVNPSQVKNLTEINADEANSSLLTFWRFSKLLLSVYM